MPSARDFIRTDTTADNRPSPPSSGFSGTMALTAVLTGGHFQRPLAVTLQDLAPRQALARGSAGFVAQRRRRSEDLPRCSRSVRSLTGPGRHPYAARRWRTTSSAASAVDFSTRRSPPCRGTCARLREDRRVRRRTARGGRTDPGTEAARQCSGSSAATSRRLQPSMPAFSGRSAHRCCMSSRR